MQTSTDLNQDLSTFDVSHRTRVMWSWIIGSVLVVGLFVFGILRLSHLQKTSVQQPGVGANTMTTSELNDATIKTAE